jgi:hypothetical protein
MTVPTTLEARCDSDQSIYVAWIDTQSIYSEDGGKSWVNYDGKAPPPEFSGATIRMADGPNEGETTTLP